jgi:hypothetical protein
VEVIRRVQEMCQKLKVVEGQDPLSREAQRNATLLFHTLLRSTLASKRVLAEYKLSRDAWQWLAGEIETRWVEGLGGAHRPPAQRRGLLVQAGLHCRRSFRARPSDPNAPPFSPCCAAS